jgi:putative ATPase
MKEIGYGQGYQYAHDAPEARVDQEHLPPALKGREYYHPSGRGLEGEIGRRLAEWRRWRAKQAREAEPGRGD